MFICINNVLTKHFQSEKQCFLKIQAIKIDVKYTKCYQGRWGKTPYRIKIIT